VLKLAEEATWPAPAVTAVTETTRYGTATAMAWGRLRQRLTGRAGWEDHADELPVIVGTSSGCKPVTCPATAARTRYGCGPRPPGPPSAR
jgi:hypothetical protein